MNRLRAIALLVAIVTLATPYVAFAQSEKCRCLFDGKRCGEGGFLCPCCHGRSGPLCKDGAPAFGCQMDPSNGADAGLQLPPTITSPTHNAVPHSPVIRAAVNPYDASPSMGHTEPPLKPPSQPPVSA